MKTQELEKRVCPKCGQVFHGHPAISRENSELLICADCGTRESLASIGIDEAEQEKILEVIHRHCVSSFTD